MLAKACRCLVSRALMQSLSIGLGEASDSKLEHGPFGSGEKGASRVFS